LSLIKTILADDHKLFCEGLDRVLGESGRFEVVGKYHNGQTLLENLGSSNAELMVIDVEMPLLNGFDTIKRIRMNNPDLRIAVLSMHEESVFSQEALALGANAYLNKSMESESLIEALLQVCSGKKIFPVFTSTVSSIESPFSEREQEILKLISSGKTSDQIAERLHISHLTVKAHRRNMMRKLNVGNAAELISKALEMGFLYNSVS
jgi:DNA-binding NarL/FixJ family response regulator